ncbi:sorbosone dehydrogenase family protein [Glycomyces sp. YM15]|uniref:PQQ-dependent sugar dehydrogenase n=1 Tax=Glycomyces sp. YM15 TaxID=2800446 RepID=UPI00196599C2|nr:PQQ-dependent sugar dehydrogenase [Glycomyces sp. YM15]
MRRRLPAIGAAFAGLALAVGTATASAQEGPEIEPLQDPEFDFRTGDTVATGLTIPWGLGFLPDGSGIVAERNSGDVLRIGTDADPVVLGNLEVVAGAGQFDERGLLGLAISPTFATDGWVYAYLSTAEDNRVVRFHLDTFEPEPVLTGIPSALNHNGGRLAFGPDDKLYITTGDANDTANSQDLESLGGKILRVNADGSVPEDNPIAGSPVYSYGHRNVQGLSWGPDGEMYATEFGQNTWDELNHIRPGANYGWPEVEGTGGDPEYVDPLVTWTTAEASPSGGEVVGDTMYVGALRGQRLWTVPVAGGEAGDPVAVLESALGRIRTVELGPDGWLWVTTSNGGDQDKVVRYRPIGG